MSRRCRDYKEGFSLALRVDSEVDEHRHFWQVPVIVLDYLSETQKRAYIMADNKLAENAFWDDEKLKAEVQALQNEVFQLKTLGFDEEETIASSRS